MYDDITFSVSALNQYVQRSLKSDPLLRSLRLRGEIGGFKVQYPSGHWYFTLKDETCSIRAVVWRQNALRMSMKPDNGMQVIVTGSVDLYPVNGSYQLNVTAMRPDGVGSLYVQFERLKARLQAEGLFDEARKRMLPLLPKKIAAVTAETGAVIHDICNVAKGRNPGVPIVLVPVKVQGEGADQEIAEGIRIASRIPDVEVVIVGRGGGSMEDLWCFNSETVVRAIANCPVPVISAVGHETDFTLADFAADVRASTPSNAAELAVPEISELSDGIHMAENRLDSLMEHLINEQSLRIAGLKERLRKAGPEESIANRIHQIELLYGRIDTALLSGISGFEKQISVTGIRLEKAMDMKAGMEEHRLQQLKIKLLSVDPMAILDRGYAYVTSNGQPVKSAFMASQQEKLTLRFRDGVTVTVPEK